MVLIIKKINGKKCVIILVPKNPLYDMIRRHVDRIGLASDRNNTCLVTSQNDWTGYPPHSMAVWILIETLKKRMISPGERNYPILPNDLIKCRDFDMVMGAVSPQFEGNFLISFIKLNGRGKLAIKEAERFEPIGPIERLKIMNTFRKTEGRFNEEIVFLATHLTPARR